MNVNFYQTPSGRSPVEDFIDSLAKADQARFVEVITGIEEQEMAYARAQFKPLHEKLWEIKFSAPSCGYRMAYVIIQSDKMIILHAFKKSTQKTPLRDIALAEKRMKEVLQ